MGKKLNKAFSLIELMVVLSIFVVICALSAPLFVKSPDYVLKSELNKLFMVFSYAQQKAMASGVAQKVIFDTSKNTYSYPSFGGKTCITKLSEPIIFGFIDTVKGPPASPVQAISSAVTFQANDGVCCATCLPDGKISPGTVYLVDGRKTVMGAITCSVSPVAYVRKYCWNKGTWGIIGLDPETGSG